MNKKIIIILLSGIFFIANVYAEKRQDQFNLRAKEKKIKKVSKLSYLKKMPGMIPRKILFGNPDRSRVQISPDGLQMTWLAPSKKGVMNIWLKTIGKDDLRMITKDEKRGIRGYGWAWNGEQIVYIQDKDGDENWHLYVVDVKRKKTRDLTPFKGVKAQNFIFDKNFPDEIYIGLNKRDKKVFDMYRLNLRTGKMKIDTKNPGNIAGWMTDHKFVIRVAYATNPRNGDTIIKFRENKQKKWRDLAVFPFGENGGPVAFTEDNKNLYIKSTIGSNTQRLVEIDTKTGKEVKKIFHDNRVDIASVVTHPDNHKILAVSVNYLKRDWVVLDESIRADIGYLKTVADGSFYVVNGNRANNVWIVVYVSDIKPVAYYIYYRDKKKARFLFTHQPNLAKYELSPMKPVIIKSRDKLDLVSYLTHPMGIKPKNLSLVIVPHGGPQSRDSWGLRPLVQWLANRGYAVLQVNFRGSTGFGKKFVNAGNGEWGKKMQDDITDAVKWAIKKGIADPKRVAIMGGSYGGYATLAGVTFTPDLYACGVDIVGPSNLKTLLETIPPYWSTFKKQLQLRIGDVENNEKLNRQISPMFHAHKIKVPLIIAQGANDPRVKISEADQMVKAMRDNKIPVTYVVYPDEGHGFARPENRLDFYGRVEQFLSDYLGGRVEKRKKIKGSTAELR